MTYFGHTCELVEPLIIHKSESTALIVGQLVKVVQFQNKDSYVITSMHGPYGMGTDIHHNNNASYLTNHRSISLKSGGSEMGLSSVCDAKADG